MKKSMLTGQVRGAGSLDRCWGVARSVERGTGGVDDRRGANRSDLSADRRFSHRGGRGRTKRRRNDLQRFLTTRDGRAVLTLIAIVLSIVTVFNFFKWDARKRAASLSEKAVPTGFEADSNQPARERKQDTDEADRLRHFVKVQDDSR